MLLRRHEAFSFTPLFLSVMPFFIIFFPSFHALFTRFDSSPIFFERIADCLFFLPHAYH